MPPIGIQYIYRVLDVERVVDGDTFYLDLDVGFRQQMLVHIRLSDYDTPEVWGAKSSFEKLEAHRAALFVMDYFERVIPTGNVYVQTQKDPGSFGRWLGTVFVEGELSLGELLANERLATHWPSKWREVYDKD